MSNTKPLLLEELNPPLNRIVISSVEELEIARPFLERALIFAFDVETNPHEDFTQRKIRTIQFGDRNEQYIIDLLPFARSAGVSLLSCQSIAYKPSPVLEALVRFLKPYLESKKSIKIGHHLQFDYEMMKYNLGIDMRNFYDTYLAEKCIYVGKVPFKVSGFWALDDLVARYLGLIISKEEQKSFDLETDLNERQINYCALDCRLPFGIKAGQADFLTKGNLWKALEIENNAIPAFGTMFLNGFKVDKKKWLRTVHKYKMLHKKHIALLDRHFLPIVGSKTYDMSHLAALEKTWRDTGNKTPEEKEQRREARMAFYAARKIANDIRDKFYTFEGQAAINYASPINLYKVIRDLPKFVEANKLNKENRRLPKFANTDDRTLTNFAEHRTWDIAKFQENDPTYEQAGLIDALRLYRESKKLLDSYGTDWLRKYVHPVTGRVHGRLNQFGADTGRSSCEKPNMQQLPRGEEWRSCFIADTGNKIITMDYSGAELVILAELSREPIFVHAYQNGWDIHSVNAELVFEDEWKNGALENCAYYANGAHKKCKCPKHMELRTKAKPVGLGLAYGMEAQKLADQVGVTYEEAEKIIAKFKEKFQTLMKYLVKSGEDAKTKCESRSLAQRRRYFYRPSHKEAYAKAKNKIAEKKDAKDLLPNGKYREPNSREVSWAFKAMFSAIEREGKNNPLQSSNADISKIAMGTSKVQNIEMFSEILEYKYNAKLVMFVHDEFVVECPEEFAGTTKQPGECTLYMEKAAIAAAASLIKTVPMGAEYNVADYWSK